MVPLTDPRKKSEDNKVTLENALYFITHHSEAIIQWLFLTILLLSAAIIARALFTKTRDGADVPGGTHMALPENGEIKSVLQKILDQTAKLESVTLEKVANGGGGDPALNEAQLQALKKELQTREEELNQLKAAAATNPGSGGHAVASEGVAVRIKELESKLAEYEILEDDIADLSLYKEENVRLREELEKVKAAPAATPEPEPGAHSPAPAAPKLAPADAGEEIVAQFAQAVHGETPPAAAARDGAPSKDPMTDFENLMQTEKSAAPPPPQAAPSKSMFGTESAAPAPAAVTAEADDLFAEFASTPVEEPSHPPDLDTEKMMAEMAALSAVEPSSGDRALDDAIDTEKMALEATSLVKA